MPIHWLGTGGKRPPREIAALLLGAKQPQQAGTLKLSIILQRSPGQDEYFLLEVGQWISHQSEILGWKQIFIWIYQNQKGDCLNDSFWSSGCCFCGCPAQPGPAPHLTGGHLKGEWDVQVFLNKVIHGWSHWRSSPSEEGRGESSKTFILRLVLEIRKCPLLSSIESGARAAFPTLQNVETQREELGVHALYQLLEEQLREACAKAVCMQSVHLHSGCCWLGNSRTSTAQQWVGCRRRLIYLLAHLIAIHVHPQLQMGQADISL